MSEILKLVEVVDNITSMKDVDEIKTYTLSIISLLQKELQHTRANIEDFRNIYGFNGDDKSYKKAQIMNIFIDPVINAEIISLKKNYILKQKN